VIGTLNSTPSTQFTIEFFANSAADESGYGEGEVFLGAATVMADANGNAAFLQTFTGDFSELRFITATATDSSGNTSEFSRAIESVVDLHKIVDNSDAAGFALSGEWTPGSGPGVGRNDNLLIAFGEPEQTDTASWTFNLEGPGQYRVSATWFTNPEYFYLFSDAARFEVFDPAAGVVRGVVNLNQQVFPDDFTEAGSAWEDLGVFDVTGSSLVVRLTSGNDNATYVVADAVRVERVGDLPTGPEIHVAERGSEITDGGQIELGATELGRPVERTFEISNLGSQMLQLGAPTVPAGYTLVGSPAQTSLAPGETTSFVVRLNGSVPGVYSGVVSIPANDSDEAPFDFNVSGTVLPSRVLDDGDPGYSQTGDFQSAPLSIARDGDNSYALFDWAPSEASWTFTVTPGQYRLAATWFDTADSKFYATNAPFTVLDGSTPLGTFQLNQRQAPNDFAADGSSWETIGDAFNVTGGALTVRLTNVGADGYVLADAVMLERVGPEGAATSAVDAAMATATPVERASLLPEMATVYSPELEEVVAIVAEDTASRGEGDLGDAQTPAGRLPTDEPLDLALADLP
jgi:hypothetical protein